ncbi:hypothetical protein AB0H36_44030 [Kribbella sp. NPDC050820]|uniref:hypothetical protein n=1 Tax=Kribbella sp. NPDC050820 TaxID=3155408 RepID=UPI0034005878
MIMGNSPPVGPATTEVRATRPLSRPCERRVQAAGSCDSLTCACEPDNRERSAQSLRAYAYLCSPLLVCRPEVTRTRERLAAYAADAELELVATFVEDAWQRSSAFERLFQATIRDHVQVVLLPSMLHFTVLGSPRWIKPSFEAVTGARIVTMS